MFGFSALAVRLGLATKPDAYSWPQVLGAGALSGIGFTMSLLIAHEAFTAPPDFAAAKIAVFAGSILAAVAGTALRSEEHTSELQTLMRISYAVFCLKQKKHTAHRKPNHY